MYIREVEVPVLGAPPPKQVTAAAWSHPVGHFGVDQFVTRGHVGSDLKQEDAQHMNGVTPMNLEPADAIRQDVELFHDGM